MEERNIIKLKDPAVRRIKENDIESVINLFKMNYGDNYSLPEFYDEYWIKKNIYSDDIIWLVLEEENEVIASGAVILDYGDYNDQIGEIGRLVVHPDHKGKGIGRRIIEAMINAADDTVEFVFGEARTAHPISQILLESSGFSPIGFMPSAYATGNKRESYVLYGNLYGNAKDLRTKESPKIIPEIEKLASFSLNGMNLPCDLKIIKKAKAYNNSVKFIVKPMEKKSLIRLLSIKHGRLIDPYIYGCLSLDQGFSYIKRRQAKFLVAYDKNDNPAGAIGYQEDIPSNIVNFIELIGESDELKGQLINDLITLAVEKLNAKIITANISAYNPALQKTFVRLGFFPACYAPAMVFNGQARYDTIKMFMSLIPYERGEMKLTDKAGKTVDIIEDFC